MRGGAQIDITHICHCGFPLSVVLRLVIPQAYTYCFPSAAAVVAELGERLRAQQTAPLALVGALVALAAAAPPRVLRGGGPPPAAVAHSGPSRLPRPPFTPRLLRTCRRPLADRSAFAL